MTLQTHIVESYSALPEIAKSLINKFPQKRIFAFYGTMGAGKTTFIKAICDYLEVIDTVSSPTFAIVNEYRMSNSYNLVYHFDLYRINKEDDMVQIGYEDYLYSGNYCLIEWPEKAEKYLPSEAVIVKLEHGKHANSRVIKF